MFASTAVVAIAIGLSAWLYTKATLAAARKADPLAALWPAGFACLQRKFFIDELYQATIIRANAAFARLSDWLDRALWSGLVHLVARATAIAARLNRGLDEHIVNGGFDQGSNALRQSGRLASHWQNGQTQRYLRVLGVGFVALALFLIWRAQ